MQRNSVVEQFEFNARTAPDAIALEREGQAAVTYGDLNRQANRIAHALIASGVQARGKSIVGLFLPAGTDYVAALLGVAKTGAVFLPLPPDLPGLRLAAYMDMAGVEHLVTDAEHAGLLGERLAGLERKAAVIRSDATGDGTESDPGVAIAPGDGCYVMFTSGSTGAPKGILGQQRGLSHFLKWELSEFGLDASVRVSWLAPPTFDVSLRDILVPLMARGTLCIPTEETRTAPQRLVAWLRESGCSLVHCVPTVLRLMISELRNGNSGDAPFPALRHLLVAGEPLLGADVADWRAVAGTAAEVVNVYGPTETTLAKVFHRVSDLPEDPRRILPIGRPLPNTAILILSGTRLCQPGEIGEIHIRTPYRSLGYLNAPELTDSVFVPNPLEPDSDDRIYRTGDMGRYLPDGTVECLGRRDNQIKINGIRIELAEVEAALRGLPGIHEAVAATQPGADGTQVLVGYYTREDGEAEPLESEALRDGLDQVLPAGMQPSLFMVLPKLPKTISGKVNRKALPTPESLFYSQHDYEPPAGPVEKSLARIWAGLFGLSRVGVTTKFVDYGGDSLKAIRATQQIFRELGAEVPLKAFFEAGTIRALAASIATGAADKSQHTIPRVADAADYPVTHAQSRLWRLDRMGVAPTAYNLAEAYQFVGPVDAEALERAVRVLVARHESLRTTFVERDGMPRQVVHPCMDWHLEQADLRRSGNPEAAAEMLAAANQEHRFDLETGPLLRIVLARLPDRADGTPAYLFLFNIHHIVADLWSLAVFVRELNKAYSAARKGEEKVFPDLALRYRDVATSETRELRDGDLEKARRYWLDRLGGGIKPLELPADRSRPPVQTFNGRTMRLPFGVSLSRQLRELAEARGTTLFCALTALLKVLLHRYTGKEDVIVGSPVANRDHPDLAGLIGYLVNTVALRDRVEAEGRFGDLLDSVAGTVGDALTHQAYPFDALVDELDLPRDMSRSPVFDVMIVVQTFDPIDPELDGAVTREFGRQNGWNFSRYDMVFHFQEDAGDVVLDLNYNTDLFDDERIDACGRHLRTLAESIVTAPESAIADLPLIDVEERQRLDAISRGGECARPEGMTMSRLVAERAREWPDRPALREPDTAVPYAALISAVARLGERLVAEGIEPGDRVAVLAERSIASVTAMLAILRIGAVYVPVDASFPAARVRLMTGAVGCRLLITDAGPAIGEEGLPPQLAVTDVLGKPEGWDIDPEPLGEDRSAPGEVAYVIFTSGSTGQPKPVMVEHAGFVNMSLGQIEAFGLDHEDRTLQFASPSFDASLANIFMALFAGGAVILPPRSVIESLPRFEACLREQEVTCVTLPPAYLRALGDAPLDPVRVLISAGEAAPVAELAARSADRAVFNAYGPTEFSVCSTIHRVAAGDAGRPRLPIGTPLPNTSLFILDDRLRPVPMGVTGEIFLGGVGVARGYQGMAEETAARFIVHPETGERLYRTGDLGRWLADGTVDLVGRADDQIKIAGNRIEPGEVEEALRAVSGVRDAHVAVVSRADGSPALAGWYVREPRPELWPSVAEFYVYDDVAYGSMAADEARNRRYRDAFAKRLAGKTVVDIGTGPVAILARLAVEAGARKVYAVDLLKETADKARRTVRDLGLEDRIQVLHGDARTLELPEPADWCISEIVGAIGSSEGSAVIINAARRFLKNPANMLPMRSLTRIAAVSVPEETLEMGFPPIAAHYVERIFEEVGHSFDLRLCLKGLGRERLVSTVDLLEDLDYTRDLPLEDEHGIELTLTSDAPVTGFLVWLDLQVDEDHHVDILDNPGSWLPVYLPAFPDGVDARQGDRFVATIRRRLNANGLNPDFEIVGTLKRPGRDDIPVRYRSAHFGDGFGADPFWARLFRDESVPRSRAADAVTVRRALAATLPAYAVPTYLLEVDALPMNANGKVDRTALPEPDAAPHQAEGKRTEPASAAETAVRDAWQTVLEQEDIGPDDDFFAMGGDSIRAIQISSRLLQAGYAVEVRDVFQNPTIAQLAAVAKPAVEHLADTGPVTGPVPLTPIQTWFFRTVDPVLWHHFNQAVLLRNDQGTDVDALRGAAEAVWKRHDALRARFRSNGDLPHQEFGPPDVPAGLFQVIEGGPERLETLADTLHADFNLSEGPLFRVFLTQGHGGSDEILLLAHHLVVDGVSWRILVEDFLAAYEAVKAGKAPDLSAPSASYRDFAAALTEIASETDWQSRIEWAEGLPEVHGLPTDTGATEPPRVGDAQTLKRSLDRDLTFELTGSAHRRYSTTADDLLLAGLMMAIDRGFGRDHAVVTLETHGRDHPLEGKGPFADLGRTVGWFTGFYPVVLTGTAEEPGRTIRDVRQALRQVPDGGRSYGLLTHHPGGPGVPAAASEIGYNYLGNFGAAGLRGGFVLDLDAPGASQAADMNRPHALDVLAMVVDGRMELAITYDRKRWTESTMQRFLDALEDALRRVVAHCLSPDDDGESIREFTLGSLSGQDIDDILELD